MARLDLEAATWSVTTAVAVHRRLCMNASAGSSSEIGKLDHFAIAFFDGE